MSDSVQKKAEHAPKRKPRRPREHRQPFGALSWWKPARGCQYGMQVTVPVPPTCRRLCSRPCGGSAARTASCNHLTACATRGLARAHGVARATANTEHCAWADGGHRNGGNHWHCCCCGVSPRRRHTDGDAGPRRYGDGARGGRFHNAASCECRAEHPEHSSTGHATACCVWRLRLIEGRPSGVPGIELYGGCEV